MLSSPTAGRSLHDYFRLRRLVWDLDVSEDELLLLPDEEPDWSGGLMSTSSMSKESAASGGMILPAPPDPYAYSDGQCNLAFIPLVKWRKAWSQHLITRY